MATRKRAETKYTIFENLKKIIPDYYPKSLAYYASVSPTTLKNWVSGKTKTPRIDTLTRVANAVGFNIELKMKATTINAATR